MLVVGEPRFIEPSPNFGEGRVHFFRRSGLNWVPEGSFTTSGLIGDLGSSVAVHGSWAVVGRPSHANALVPGSVRFFKYDGTAWTDQGELSDGTIGNQFGAARAVAIDGKRAVIGALTDDAGFVDEGAVWVAYRKNGMYGSLEKLDDQFAAANRRFGTSVAISGDTIVVATASGGGDVQIYRFDENQLKWFHDTQVMPSSGAGLEFGYDIDLDGEFLIVGARGFSPAGSNSGAAFIYRDQGIGMPWTEEATLLVGSDTTSGDRFGSSVAISGVGAFVGAPMHDRNANGFGKGAVYLFRRDASGQWTETQKVVTSSPLQFGDEFGHSVEAGATWLGMGATLGDGTISDSGVVYTLNHSTCPYGITTFP